MDLGGDGGCEGRGRRDRAEDHRQARDGAGGRASAVDQVANGASEVWQLIGNVRPACQLECLMAHRQARHKRLWEFSVIIVADGAGIKPPLGKTFWGGWS